MSKPDEFFDDFLNRGIPAMFLSALIDAAEKTERETEHVNPEISKVVRPDPGNVKKAASVLGDDTCEACEKIAATLYYTYASNLKAGFSPAQAFDLTKAVMLNNNKAN